MHVYVDMDGVVANFDATIQELYGQEGLDNQQNASEFWKARCVNDQVFLRMPPIPAGIDMVRRLHQAKLPVCFLTSTGGMPNHIEIACQKLQWLERHGIGGFPVAFAMNTKGKAAYAKPGEILIDDQQKVVNAWSAAGGVGILFKPSYAWEILSELTRRRRGR